MRYILLALFLVLTSCTNTNYVTLNGENFSAKFVAAPNRVEDGFHKGDPLPNYVVYLASKMYETAEYSQSITISKLSDKECKGDDKQKIEQQINKFDNYALTKWVVLDFGQDKKQIAAILSGGAPTYERKVSEDIYDEMNIVQGCIFYSIRVYGFNKEYVDEIFEQVTNSFEFNDNKDLSNIFAKNKRDQ